jgi:assimilatory nitrate reductase catalytic subunit
MSSLINLSAQQFLSDLLHQKVGPLTRELLREPGGFGLGQVPTTIKPDAVTTSVCGYCATGCSLNIHLKDGEAINLTPNTNYPVNLGMACPKGWEALTVLDAPDRAVSPMKRNHQDKLQPIDWDTALREFVGRMKEIQWKYGPNSTAFLSTGQIPLEEMVFLGSLTRFGMGMIHGDSNTRQCMATAAVAYKQSFGYDAPPYTYADFEESDVIVLVGSNICIAHPIMWERVMRNPHKPKIIVMDPRVTETAMNATQHLAIKPKSDQYLLYGVARILIAQGWIDKQFIANSTVGFEEFAQFVQQFTMERVKAETGLSEDAILQFAETIHAGKRVSFWWTMGVNQSYQGVRTAQGIINLALMTGNIGRPGTGANSITGQCNAMGSRLFGNTTSLLGGHDFANPIHRQKIAKIMNIKEEVIPTEPSIPYNEIMEGILRGKIKGLWVICTNTAHSWINQLQAKDILSRLDFLVVQDMYHTTETAQMADLVLPAAGWGEKDGVLINSERRLGIIKKVKKAPGEALSDFSIFQLIAKYWGCGNMFDKWNTPADVFETVKECSRGMPCDITGIKDYQMIEEMGGIQWPYPESRLSTLPESESESNGSHTSVETKCKTEERRLFTDGVFYHKDGLAKFLYETPYPMPEPPTAQYPLILLTGRGTASQWHTQTRTSKSAVLRKLYPVEPFVEINPQDARELGITQNDWVVIESQRGRIQAMAFLTNAVASGQIFVPMHYEVTNQLTDAVFDPYSKQPSYKACAVRISAAPH